MNFLARISETLCFSREFLRRYVSRGQILKSVFETLRYGQVWPLHGTNPPKFHL